MNRPMRQGYTVSCCCPISAPTLAVLINSIGVFLLSFLFSRKKATASSAWMNFYTHRKEASGSVSRNNARTEAKALSSQNQKNQLLFAKWRQKIYERKFS